MTKSHLKLVSPATVNRTVATPLRRPNAELRTREYMTDAEVERLTDAAKANRPGHRDATMVLLAYKHGLRASELVDLRWDQIDFNNATLAVRRAKKGTPSTHPIRGDELRALPRLAREQDPKSASYSRPNVVRRSHAHGGACGGGGWLRVQGPPAHAAPRLRLRPGQQGSR